MATAIRNRLKNKRVLVTCGPTWVPLDGVRVISNLSTGALGNAIACALNKEGARVTLLQGPVTNALSCRSIKVIKFYFFDELAKLFERELKKNYPIVIHAAAVSDYRPSQAINHKISSNFSKLKLTLVPTEKLIEKIKRISPASFLVGFKLESQSAKNMLLAKSRNLFKKSHCDLVVANTVAKNSYRGYLIDGKSRVLAEAQSRTAMSQKLIKALKERV